MSLGAARDVRVRGIREVIPGETPSTDMKEHIFSTFDTTTRDYERSPSDGVETNGEVSDNPSTGFSASVSASHPVTYDRGLSREILSEVCCSEVAAAVVVQPVGTVAFEAPNKITLPAGSWPFVAGDHVCVYAPAPATLVYAPVASVDGAVMTLDWVDLPTNASVADVQIYHSGRQMLGGEFLTSTYEAYHGPKDTGEVRRYLSWREITESFSSSGAVQASFSGDGARLPEILQGAQLPNATISAPVQQQYTSLHHWQAPSSPGAGLGFRVDGQLMGELEVEDLSYKVSRARLMGAGGGKGLRKDMTVDGLFQVSLEAKMFGGKAPPDAQLHSLLEAGPGAVHDISWGYMDDAGRVRVVRFPALQLTKASRTGTNATGPFSASVAWVAKADPLGRMSMYNLYYFDAPAV